jgi:hypothetical protein
MSRPLTPQLITPPAAYPVSLPEVKAQLNIDTDDYDARLAGLIAAATNQVEAYLGLALITRTYQGFLDHWPHRREGSHFGEWPATQGSAAGPGWYAKFVELPMPPLISVGLVQTFDDTDTPTVFSPSSYFVDTASSVGRIVLRNGQEWPIPARTANGIEIQWTAGVGPTLRPMQDDDIRAGILIAVGALNEHRGDTPAPDLLPDAARAVLSAKRFNWL